jgi:hypothetical protein
LIQNHFFAHYRHQQSLALMHGCANKLVDTTTRSWYAIDAACVFCNTSQEVGTIGPAWMCGSHHGHLSALHPSEMYGDPYSRVTRFDGAPALILLVRLPSMILVMSNTNIAGIAPSEVWHSRVAMVRGIESGRCGSDGRCASWYGVSGLRGLANYGTGQFDPYSGFFASGRPICRFEAQQVDPFAGFQQARATPTMDQFQEFNPNQYQGFREAEFSPFGEFDEFQFRGPAEFSEFNFRPIISLRDFSIRNLSVLVGVPCRTTCLRTCSLWWISRKVRHS